MRLAYEHWPHQETLTCTLDLIGESSQHTEFEAFFGVITRNIEQLSALELLCLALTIQWSDQTAV